MQINLAFKFHREAALNQMVLVDKINRAKPKVQSALLEAMAKILLPLKEKPIRVSQPFLT
jgi:MoxR-like ATPase